MIHLIVLIKIDVIYAKSFNQNLFPNPLDFQKHFSETTVPVLLFQLFISFMVFGRTGCREHVLHACCVLLNFEFLVSSSSMKSPLRAERMMEHKPTANKYIFFILGFSGLL